MIHKSYEFFWHIFAIAFQFIFINLNRNRQKSAQKNFIIFVGYIVGVLRV